MINLIAKGIRFKAFLAFVIFIQMEYGVGCCKHRTPLQVIPVTSPVQLGEGPHWDSDSQTLFYVDINSNEIHRYCPRGGKETTLQFSGFGNGVSFVIPVEGTHSRQLLTSVGHDIVLVDWYHQNALFCPSSQNVTIIASVEVDRKGNRWNDGKADANGRLWAGTMGPIVEIGHIIPNRGTLFVLNSDSDVPLAVVSPISVSNGLAWNENNTLMYYIDYLTAGVDVFDFNLESGTIANRRKIFDLREHGIEGYPDGMTIDNNGNLWVACYNGSQVINVNPETGALIRQIWIPASLVTSVTFGGPNMDILFVTTAKWGLSAEDLRLQPYAGSVFAVFGLGVTALSKANNIVRASEVTND